MLGERGRGARSEGYRAGRGRGYMERMRESRERSRSLCRTSKSNVGYRGRGCVDHGQSAIGLGQNRWRGSGELEGRGRTGDERMQWWAKSNMD